MKGELIIKKIKKPIINCDGYYPQCPTCYYFDLIINQDCPKCNQKIDWSWCEELKGDENTHNEKE